MSEFQLLFDYEASRFLIAAGSLILPSSSDKRSADKRRASARAIETAFAVLDSL